MDLIDVYLTKYRNELTDPEHRGKGPRFLFPRPDGVPKIGRVFADSICRVLERELASSSTSTLFRHLSCHREGSSL